MTQKNLHRKWHKRVCKARQSAHTDYGFVTHFGGGDHLRGKGMEGLLDSVMGLNKSIYSSASECVGAFMKFYI
jgi:hypothetical protein